MIIRNIFEKNIDRKIDGVVKADQIDQESLWMELDEFEVTKEVRKQILQFFGTVRDARLNPSDPAMAGRTGVWISGFFGCGKSMLLKILSLTMANEKVIARGQNRTPLEFLLPKVGDELLKGEIQEAVGPGAETVLFGIHTKAEAGRGDEALIDVFFRVFAEHRGFCGSDPNVAAFEEELAKRDRLILFKQEFETLADQPWDKVAGAYQFYGEEVRSALVKTGFSAEDATRQVDKIEGMTLLSPENFATKVKEYLDSKGPDSRIMFFADEMGNFIGQNGKLMLSLQSVAEELGVRCGGRAWVVVTAQEDIESVIGQLSTQRANDFSKIQGRFHLKLKLSGANADEVIQRRILKKNPEGESEVKKLFDVHGEVLKQAISLKPVGMTFNALKDGQQFAAEYPFLPYQFQLVQKVFTAIRTHGAVGQHLGEGERSMLDAFQIAAKSLAGQEVGALAPLHSFYPSIEGNLEAVVKRTIDNSSARGLSESEVAVLKTLFLIRYVEEIQGNVDTLITLSMSKVDEDRVALKRSIEGALGRLENETLIGRNGDVYYFLTDDEQAIDRAIRDYPFTGDEDSRELGRLLFAETLKDRSKIRYSNGKDFTIARSCDGKTFGTAVGAEIEVKVVSQFDSNYFEYSSDAKAVMESAAESNALIVLPESVQFRDEFLRYLQVRAYLLQKDSTDLPQSTRDIHKKKGQENAERRLRILKLLKELFTNARFYVAGNTFEPKSAEPETIFSSLAEALVGTAFTSLSMLQALSPNPLVNMQTTLRANDVQQQLLEVKNSENRDAIHEVLSRVSVLQSLSKQIVISELVDHFSKRPFGWPELETALIIARLVVAGEIQVFFDGGVVAADDLYDLLSKTGKWKQLVIRKKESVSEADLSNARNLAQQLFHTAVPSTGEDAFKHIVSQLRQWESKMLAAKPYAQQKDRYPGLTIVNEILQVSNSLLQEKDTNRFLKNFIARADELRNLQPIYANLAGFYESQRPAWDKLLSTYELAKVNEAALRSRNPEAANAVSALRAILVSDEPYSEIVDANDLASTIKSAIEKLISEAREEASGAVTEYQESLDRALEGVPEESRHEYQKALRELRLSLANESSTGNLLQVRERATELYNAAIQRLTARAQEQGAPTPPKAKPIRTIKAKTKTLESQEDVEAYLSDLKVQIMAAIEQGEKVQVQ